MSRKCQINFILTYNLPSLGVFHDMTHMTSRDP